MSETPPLHVKLLLICSIPVGRRHLSSNAGLDARSVMQLIPNVLRFEGANVYLNWCNCDAKIVVIILRVKTSLRIELKKLSPTVLK